MNRCRVLIVDDEIMIRQGLSKLIAKNAANWEIAGEARNGREALEKLEQLKPQLIITDIRMPYMDGIELARAVHEMGAEIAVIILTGFKDFEYAQGALRYGVLDFLLKPCPEEEVTQALDKAYCKITGEMRELERKSAEARQNARHTVRSIMLRLPNEQAGLEEVKRSFLGRELLLVKVATYFPKAKAYGYNDMNLLQFAIANIMEELMGKYKLQGELLHVTYDILALFHQKSPSAADFSWELAATVLELLGISLRTFEAGEMTELAKLSGSIDRLSGPVVTGAEPVAVTLQQAISQTKIRNLQNDMMSHIMLGQADQVREYMESYIGRMGNLPVEQAKLEASALGLALHEMMQEDFASKDMAGEAGDEINKLYRLASLQEVLDWAAGQMELFFKEFLRWMNDHDQNIIEKSIRYIHEHYMESCDLKEVADHVYLSANYFSSMFRKETGESFINYVMKVRIDKAKMLISNTDLKVFEIAQRVGYDDPNYFTTVFKQLTGMSPRQYRKDIRG